ncbi:MAG: hypothetical protein WAJ85_00660 [Candidatus Baltobacteraceae bacterium]
MSINESLDRVLELTRELQQSISDALNKATEQLKPEVENSLRVARELQATLVKHLEASSELSVKNTTAVLAHLHDYIALGTGALSDSAEQVRIAAKKLVEQSQKVAEAAAAAATSTIHTPAAPAEKAAEAEDPAPPREP